MGTEKRLKEILHLRNPKKVTKLRALAVELGCSLEGTYENTPSGRTKHLENEVVRRIREADRNQRDARVWWFAMASAVGSIFSALAAWSLVLYSLSK